LKRNRREQGKCVRWKEWQRGEEGAAERNCYELTKAPIPHPSELLGEGERR